MKGFLKDFQNLGKKKNNNTIRGGGQSLGGSKPGTIIPISIPEHGSIGVQLENTREGSAIVAKVMDGSTASKAGLKRGDVICHSQTNGTKEMAYRQFLDMAKSDSRPLIFDVRRVESGVGHGSGSGGMRADSYAKRQAVIAAAMARDKENKQKKKPISKLSKELTPEERDKIERQKLENEKKNTSIWTSSNEPMTHEAREAVRIAKNDEAKHVQELGYNPYEAARSTGKQGANATVAAKHGTMNATQGAPAPSGSGGGGGSGGGQSRATSSGSGSSNNTNLAKQTTSSSTSSLPDLNDLTPIDTEFDEAFTTLITHNVSTPAQKQGLSKSLRIMKKLILNAITEGQTDDKKRMVRISNPNKLIQAAINDLDGAIQLMLSVGFIVGENDDDDSETYLIFPPGDTGPPWLSDALDRMEQYEKGL